MSLYLCLCLYLSVSLHPTVVGRRAPSGFLRGRESFLASSGRGCGDHQRPNKPTPPLLNNEDEEDDEAG